jgi:hypothetical protein
MLILSLNLFFGLPDICIPTGLPQKYMYAYFYDARIRATCAAHRNLLQFLTPYDVSEEKRT